MHGAWINARVWPMTTDDAEATAIVWSEGRILYVGNDAEATAHAERLGIPCEDLQGRLVLPGFVDAHMHLMHVGIKPLRPDLTDATSRDDALARVATWLDAHPGTGPVTAEGWDESDWPDRRWPTRHELDQLAPERPLVLRRICGHIAVANTAAATLVHPHWPERVDVETGVLLEQPSLYLNQVLPEADDVLDRAAHVAADAALRVGCTTVGTYEQEPMHRAWRRQAQNGLPIRIAGNIYPQQLEAALNEGFRTGATVDAADHHRWGGLKVFLDGSIGGHSALLREDYADKPGHRGLQNWTDEELDALFGRAAAAGIQLHAHAIGDGAVQQGLDAYERLQAASGEPATRLRHRFEHYELVDDEQAERTGQLGITACAQPNFVGEWSSSGGLYEQRLGGRYTINNRFNAFESKGVHLCFGSDGMPFGPLYGIQCAIRHPVESERPTLRHAIALYTREAAVAIHWDDAIGTLEPGKHADLIALRDEGEPVDWVLEQAVVGGEVRHRGDRAVPSI